MSIADPRVEAVVQWLGECSLVLIYDTDAPQSAWVTDVEAIPNLLAAADAVDPLRQPDQGDRFAALGTAICDTLDEIIGLADDFLGANIGTRDE